jgi:hypothetical protein
VPFVTPMKRIAHIPTADTFKIFMAPLRRIFFEFSPRPAVGANGSQAGQKKSQSAKRQLPIRVRTKHFLPGAFLAQPLVAAVHHRIGSNSGEELIWLRIIWR